MPLIADGNRAQIDIVRNFALQALQYGRKIIGWLDLKSELPIGAIESENHGVCRKVASSSTAPSNARQNVTQVSEVDVGRQAICCFDVVSVK